jgi:dienelactone hydrolase
MNRRTATLWGVAALGLLLGLFVAGRRRHYQRTGHWIELSSSMNGWFENPVADGGDVPGDDPAAPETFEWCAEGLLALPGGGCFRAPEGGRGPWPLIIYLHGIFDPAAATDELSRQSRVAALGVAKGFAVLALRGHAGECSAAEYASRICWPSNEKNEDGGPSFVSEWKAPLLDATKRGASGKRYVFGFSNGGYFAGLLAERAWFEANGFVVARGGPVSPVKASGEKVPLLLTLSEDDPSHDEMVKLDLALTENEWPHERFMSQGGHALPDVDIEAAVTFFVKQERGEKAP